MGTWANKQQSKMIAVIALLCLSQVALGNVYYGAPLQYAHLQARPIAYVNNPTLRPEDAAAVNELGPAGIQTGKDALNVASKLVKDVFPAEGPIVVNGAIQTKWGAYALPNPQDADLVEKFLDATRDLIKRMPIIYRCCFVLHAANAFAK